MDMPDHDGGEMWQHIPSPPGERYLGRIGGSGAATLRSFHDRLPGSRGLPPALAERALTSER